MANASAKTSSHVFAEQIKQLEWEGNKLLVATNNLGDSLVGLSSPVGLGGGLNGVRTSPTSLSALTDITAEQKTIDQLRSQLDAQSLETERLSRELVRSGSQSPSMGASSATSLRTAHHHRSLSSLDIPISTDYKSRSSTIGANNNMYNMPVTNNTSFTAKKYDYAESAFERQLKIAREENETLRVRMREALKISEEQKQHFRINIEDLKAKLNEAVLKRDTVLSQKNKEVQDHESAVHRMQTTVNQLEQANRLQEETLLDMNSKMETLLKDQYGLEALQNQVRSLLIEREQRQGQPFYDGEPIQKQSISMLCHTLEKCLQQLEANNEMKQHKNKDLILQLEDVRATLQDQHLNITKEHQDKLRKVTEAHELELSAATERAVAARKQVTSLQEQLANIQQQSEEKVRMKEDSVYEIQGRLHVINAEYDREKTLWKQKQEALELAMDQIQKDIATVKNERDEALNKMTKTESKFDELQENNTRLEGELDVARNKVQKINQAESDTREQLHTLAEQLTDKCKQVQDLETALCAVRQECDTQLQQTLDNITRESKEATREQVSVLAAQLTSVREKSNQINTQYEVLKSEHKSLSEKHESASSLLQETKEKLDVAMDKHEHMSNLLQDRNNDVERLSSERDYYFKLIDDHNKELETFKAQNEKLKIQLEEREKHLTTLQEQHTQIAGIAETQSESNKTLKEERDHYMQQLNEQIIETEEMRRSRDSLNKKFKIREKHSSSLEADNRTLALALNETKIDLEQVIKEKDTLFNELKESRYEVSTLCEQNEDEKKANEEKQLALHKDVRRLAHKLKAVENDLSLAQRTVRVQEHVDDKAIRVAGHMQKEVTAKRGQIDTLQSKIRWLEENLDSSLRDKKQIADEKDKLSERVYKIVAENERLTNDVQAYITKNTDLKERVSRLETALEKAAVKYASAQSQSEQYEQDLTRIKLKHQLELKEVERKAKLEAQRFNQTQPGSASLIHSLQNPSIGSYMNTALTHPTGLLSHVQQNAHLQHSGEMDLPVSQKPDQLKLEKIANENAVGHELRHLLDDMRSLIASGQQQQQHAAAVQQLKPATHLHVQQPAAPAAPPPAAPAAVPPWNENEHYAMAFDANNRARADDVLSGPSDIEADQQVSGQKSRSSREYKHAREVHSSRHPKPIKPSNHRHPVVSSPIKRKAPAFRITDSRLNSSSGKSSGRSTTVADKNGSTSPVSDLLCTSEVNTDKYTNDSESLSSIEASHIDTPARPARKGQLRRMYSSETQALCQRLEQRIETLSKLGNHLQEENTEMAALIEDQEERLKRVKHHEKAVKKQSKR